MGEVIRSSPASMPWRDSLSATWSRVGRALLVTNRTRWPDARSRATAAAAPSIG